MQATYDPPSEDHHALTLPDVRAFVITMGVLDQLPSDRARVRVLNFVTDKLADDACQADDRA